MALLTLGIVACIGGIPNLPPGKTETNQDSQTTDSGTTTTDSGTTGTTTTVPARCDVEEVEPNNTIDESETLPTEKWACGDFESFFDPDYFVFSALDAGWMEILVAAAERGSAADVQVNLYDSSSSVYMSDGYLTSDPHIVFPVNAGESFGAIFAEHTLLYGDSYFWYARASQVKAPVEWTHTETEPNEAFETPEVLADASPVFATIGEAGDFDWYVWTPPASATGVRYQIKSASLGAPTNLTLIIYDDAGLQQRAVYGGTIDYDPDPYYEERFTEAEPGGVRYLQIKDAASVGSRFAWYVLDVTAIYD